MTEWTLSSLHKPAYGEWSGNLRGFPPNPAFCCEEVASGARMMLFSQCSRKRGFGPEQAYCRQHSPEAKRARQDAADQKYRADMACRLRPSREHAAMLTALEAIAAGHNDPRTLAAEVLRQVKEGTL